MTPNTRKPTVEELADDDLGWWWDGNSWKCRWGSHIRDIWAKHDRWLPYSAIPDPNNTQQGEPK